MKAFVIQPFYSFDCNDNDKCFEDMIKLLEECDSSADIIVLPEYCDVPSSMPSKREFDASIKKYNGVILEKAKSTAQRCSATVFVNAASEGENGYINTTYAINKEGEVVGKYFKAHPAPSEVRGENEKGNGLDVQYSYEPFEPYVIEIDGVRYGFMTCYDFYFYEAFANLARYNVDVIIGCSHQRTDKHSALEIINRFLSYNTNAYLVRASVSLGSDSEICGCSTVIAPDGEVLLDMKSKIGVGTAEFDPHKKYTKPAGFKGAPKAHYEYIEEGRRPWLYRNAGASVVMYDDVMPYPRICAHRGFSAVLPENSMPSLGAAVALGADEIEFDLWVTKDGEIVSCHDATLDRVSNGTGKIYEKTLAELMELDFGVKFGERFEGLKIATFEDILKKFAGRVVMNIHLKTISDTCEYSEKDLLKIVSLIEKYDCKRHVYFMSGNDNLLALAQRIAPDITRCCGAGYSFDPFVMIERALRYGCKKIQLFKPHYSKEAVDKAHEYGIICNVFWSDDRDEARALLEMGVDTILTNDYINVSQVIK